MKPDIIPTWRGKVRHGVPPIPQELLATERYWESGGFLQVSCLWLSHMSVDGQTSKTWRHKLDLLGSIKEDTELGGLGRGGKLRKEDEYDQNLLYKVFKEPIKNREQKEQWKNGKVEKNWGLLPEKYHLSDSNIAFIDSVKGFKGLYLVLLQTPCVPPHSPSNYLSVPAAPTPTR